MRAGGDEAGESTLPLRVRRRTRAFGWTRRREVPGGDPWPHPSEGEPGVLPPHSRGLPECERRRGNAALSPRDASRVSLASRDEENDACRSENALRVEFENFAQFAEMRGCRAVGGGAR